MAVAIAIVLVLLVLGSLVFHFASPWWFTPLASNWQSIDDTINISLWVTGIVFVLVNLFLAYVVYKYRYNRARRADYEPENKSLESWLTIVTTLGVAAMLIPGLFVWADVIRAPDDSMVVEVVGQQWSWSYRFPGEDGVLGKSSASLVTESNPFGLDLTDPNSSDDKLVAANELILPIDKPVKLVLRSKDVLHNFAVPQFRVKMDLVPGLMTTVWFTPNRLGNFDVLCEELCGLAHFTMRGLVQVKTEQEFGHWLDNLPTFAETQLTQTLDPELGRSAYATCAACHGVNGEGNQTMQAPKLAGLSRWYIRRQLENFKFGIRGGDDSDGPGQQMASMSVLLPDAKAIEAVSAFIATEFADRNEIGDKESSANGEPLRGKQLYANCVSCHGEQGQGNYATHAPRLAGQSPWYLKRQLENFQQGKRGSHIRDTYGRQMRLMVGVLKQPGAIEDVVSYIRLLAEENYKPPSLSKTKAVEEPAEGGSHD